MIDFKRIRFQLKTKNIITLQLFSISTTQSSTYFNHLFSWLSKFVGFLEFAYKYEKFVKSVILHTTCQVENALPDYKHLLLRHLLVFNKRRM